ncbi:MAG: hypothetical protein AB7G25_12565 [Sphingomonadaceae bacterium]
MSKGKVEPAGRELVPLIPADEDVCMQTFKGGARPQARKKKSEDKFDMAKKRVFLETLRRTANITRSAKSAGVAVSTAYRHRARYPFFEEAWLEALVHAYDVLETTMLERALRHNAALSEGGLEPGDETMPREPFSNGDAMRLIKLHRDTIEQRRAEVIARKQARPEAAHDRALERLNAIYERVRAREDMLNDKPV